MGLLGLKGSRSSSEKNGSPEGYRNGSYTSGGYDPDKPTSNVEKLSDPNDEHHSLHRGLSSRQISMIAIGGSLGTGLIIGTGNALATSGPGSILISYSVVGLLCYVVMTSLGEMATWLPAAGGFAPYATRVRVDVVLRYVRRG